MIRNTPPGARIRMRTLLVTALVLTMVGAMGVQPAHAATSSALRFDGANDYVSFGNASALGLSNFTVETWFRREGAGVATSTSSAGQGGLTSAIPLLTKGRGQADGSALDMNWFLGIDTSTSTPRITADFEEGATANPGLNHAIFGTTPIVQNSWYHAAATYNGSVLRVYLNGTLEASATVNRAAQAGSIQHAALGSGLTSTGAPGGFFNGSLEEPRVWNTARTEAQIRDTLNQEVTSAPGLVARWGLNEGSGTAAANTVGPPNGTLLGTAPLAQWVAGLPFSPDPVAPGTYGLAFTDTNSYATMGAAPPLALTTFTVEGWFKRTGAGTTNTTGTGGIVNAIPLFGKGAAELETPANLNMNYLVVIDDDADVLAADFEDTAGGANHPIRGTTTIQNGRWYHAAATFDGDNWRLYLDGNLEADLPVTATPEASSIQHFGLATSITSTGQRKGYFQGELDEVRVWDHARSPAQIGSSFDQEITAAAGLVASFGLNEGVGTVAGDQAGDDVSGVIYNAGWVDGFSPAPPPPTSSDRALDFDGTNDYVTFGDPSSLDLAQFTVETWFKREGVGTATTTGTGGIPDALPLLTHGAPQAEGSNVDMDWFLGLDQSSGVLVADLEQGVGGTGTLGANHPVSGVTPVTDTDWHHAAATYDGTWRLYLDGQLDRTLAVNQPTRSDTTQLAALATALESTGEANGFFAGALDEARVWNRALSAAEIAGNMDLALTSGTGLVSRWGLNEGLGTNVGNSIAGGAGGTATNGPIWVNGFSAPTPPPPDPGNFALDFDGSDDHVTFGDPAALDLAQFTIETWFRRDGAGTATTTGTDGIPDALPLVTHGGPEVDGTAVDYNWFLGVDQSSGVLVADFEEGVGGTGPLGANHPVSGVTPVANGGWHHAAATYDGGTWRLYLDGELDATSVVNQPARSDTTQPAALATALLSTGARTGFFAGAIDEARVWNRARSEAEILAGMQSELSTGAGLVARWGINEGADVLIDDSVGAATGTAVNGPAWIAGAPFGPPPPPNDPPDAPSAPSPADGATGVRTPPTLAVDASDPNGGPLDVRFYGRPSGPPTPEDFTIVAIPDTQHYVDSPAREATFGTQTQWIVDSSDELNTRFVTHLGDVTEHIDQSEQEWIYADEHMTVLDANGIPNNLAPGNHDMSSAGVAGFYDEYFPPSRYEGNDWYGGYMGDAGDGIAESRNRLNKDNYETFEVDGLDFLVIHLEYDMPSYAVQWAQNVIAAHPDHRVIISTHLFLSTSGSRPTTVLNRTADGMSAQAVWNQLIFPNCNVFLVLNGHYPGEANRTDPNSCGEPVHQLESDYQSRANGGDGWLRIMTFEPAQNEIEVSTYSPTKDQFENDPDSRLTLSYDMQGNPFQRIGTVQTVSSGNRASVQWNGLDLATGYEWYAAVSDRSRETPGPIWSFTTAGPNLRPSVTSAEISPSAPMTADLLAANVVTDDPDGDAVDLDFQWQRDAGAGFADISGATSGTLDLSSAGAGDEGDALRVIVTPSDEGGAGAPFASSPVTIVNSPPAVSVALDHLGPGTNSTLTAIATPSDPDTDDTVTVAYEWRRNGAVIDGETGSTLDLSEPGNGEIGDTITVVVTPNDGTVDGAPDDAEATVGNAAPRVTSVTIEQATPRTNDLLTLSVSASDEESDPFDLSYRWERETSTPGTFADIPGATDAALDLSEPGNGNRGHVIRAVVVATDAGSSSDPFASDSVQVLNTSPTATVEITPATPTRRSTLTASVTSDDVDGDALNFHYVWSNGATILRDHTSVSPTDQLALTGRIDVARGDTVSVSVSPNDMEEVGTAAVDDVVIGNAGPTFEQDLADRSSAEGAAISLSAHATDPDDDTLAYAATGLPPGLSIGPTTGLITGTISAGAAGASPYSVSVTVSDDGFGTVGATDTFSWAVTTPPPADTITFRSASTGANNVGSTVVIPTPAGVQSGDVMVAVLDLKASPTVTTPAGWTLVSTTPNGSNCKQVVYVRVATGSVPASTTWTINQSRAISGVIVAYDGVSTANPIETFTAGIGTTASITAPSATSSLAGARVIGAFGINADAAIAPPAGMTERGEVASATRIRTEVADFVLGTAGATGAKTAAAAAAAANIGQLIVLRPGGPAGPNQDPTFAQNLPDRTDPATSPITLSAGATDLEGDTLSYAATGLPTGLSINATTGQITGTIAAGATANSPYATSITVSDDNFATVGATDTFTWTVTAAPPAPPIAFRSVATAANNTTTSLILPRPAGVVSGDVMVAVVDVRQNPTATAPAGWSEVSMTPNGTTYRQFVYTKVATGSEPTSYTFGFNQSRRASGAIAAYSGVSTTSPVESFTAATASSAAITAPSATTVATQAMVVGAFSINNSSAIAPPAGMTERAEIASGSAIKTEVADYVQTSPGATGAKTATAATATANIGQLIVLRPAGPAVNQDPTFDQNLANRTNNEGAVISLSAHATDPESDTLTYAATGLPTGLSINTATGLITGTISAGASTNSPFSTSITVSDDNFATVGATDTFTWTVTTGGGGGGSITFRSASFGANNVGSSVVIPTPAGVQAGDVMVAVIDAKAGPTITTPAGWTLVTTTPNGSNFKQAVYSRVATGSEAASTTWTINENRAVSGGIVAYSGVNTSTPVEAFSAGTGITTSITAPSVTSALNGAMVIGAFGINADSTIAPPAGMTERGEIVSATRIRTQISDVVLASAGATGAKTATAAAAAANIGQLIVLRPA